MACRKKREGEGRGKGAARMAILRADCDPAQAGKAEALVGQGRIRIANAKAGPAACKTGFTFHDRAVTIHLQKLALSISLIAPGNDDARHSLTFPCDDRKSKFQHNSSLVD